MDEMLPTLPTYLPSVGFLPTTDLVWLVYMVLNYVCNSCGICTSSQTCYVL